MNEPKTDWDHIDPKDPKGYYAYFGVSCYTDISEITKAYIKILTECVGKHFVINEATKAYNLLSNPEKRREYDTSYHGPNVGPLADKPGNSRGDNPISLPGGTSCFQSDRLVGSPLGFSPLDLRAGPNPPTPPTNNENSGCGCWIILIIIGILLNLYIEKFGKFKF